MTRKEAVSKKKTSVDWFFQGVLTKLGDTFDRFTGRRWTPSSSLAASELIERLKKLLDAEAKSVPGKGLVVPHNIKLRMQWDKFSEDAEAALKKLEIELLTAAVDHINDSLYYTFAPVTLEVKPDYFVEGVKLNASFEDFSEDERDVELNVTIPAMNVSSLIPELPKYKQEYIARFEINGKTHEKHLEFPAAGSLSVGRTGSNALVIDDKSVSKMHGSLSINSDKTLLVADTGSTNGTFINDVRIAYGKATAIEGSDVVKFGLVDVKFEYIPQPISQTEPEPLDEPDHQTTEIDGFEFRSGTISGTFTAQNPPVAGSSPAPLPDLLDDTIRAIPIPAKAPSIEHMNDPLAKTVPDVAVPQTETRPENQVDDEPETKY